MQYDCHVEVFDPVRWPPVFPDARTPSRTVELMGYLASEKRRAVLIQPAQYGSAHRCLLDALAKMSPETRAVASLSPYCEAGEIEELNRRGVRGTRLVVTTTSLPDLQDNILAIHRKVPINWHIELAVPWKRVGKLCALLARIERRFVVPCLRSDFLSADPQDLKKILWWLGMGNLYIKLIDLSPSFVEMTVNSHEISKLMLNNLDRILWGSGWPSALAVSSEDTQIPMRSDQIECAMNFNARAFYEFDTEGTQ